MHPLLPIDSDSKEEKVIALEKTRRWFESMHGLVIGPGLGRADYLGGFLKGLIEGIGENKIVIIDADGLWALMNEEELYKEVTRRKGVFLTPNVGEFERLWKKVMGADSERYEKKVFLMIFIFFLVFYKLLILEFLRKLKKNEKSSFLT